MAYGKLYQAGLVLDDHSLIENNPSLQSLPALLRGLGQDLWGGSGYWRPLLVLDFYSDRLVFGENWGLWHWVSLGYHLLAVGLLYTVLKGRYPARVALVGAAFFALHPIQSEAICWLAARNDLLVGLCGLGMLYFLQRQRMVLAVVAYVLALLSKESALPLPLLALLLSPEAPRRFLPFWAACLGSTLGALGLHALLVPFPPTPDLLPLFQHLPAVLSSYLARLLWPEALFSRHIDSMALGWDVQSIAFLSVGLLGLGLGFRLLSGRGRWALGLALLLFVPVLPAIALYGLAADRYLYLPMLALAVALADGLQPVITMRSSVVITALLFVTAGFFIYPRVEAWRDAPTLFAQEVEQAPSCYSRVQYARLIAMDHPDLALKTLRPALQMDCPRAWPTTIETALAAQQPALALAVAEAGRAPQSGPFQKDPAFDGLYALTLAANDRWAEALPIAQGTIPFLPAGDGAVVLAADALRRQDALALEVALRANPEALRNRAQALLNFHTEVP